MDSLGAVNGILVSHKTLCTWSVGWWKTSLVCPLVGEGSSFAFSFVVRTGRCAQGSAVATVLHGKDHICCHSTTKPCALGPLSVCAVFLSPCVFGLYFYCSIWSSLWHLGVSLFLSSVSECNVSMCLECDGRGASNIRLVAPSAILLKFWDPLFEAQVAIAATAEWFSMVPCA